MKKLLMILLAAASIGMLASCNKDDDGGPSTVLTAEVDGDEFTADDVEGWIDGDEVWIYGEDDDDNMLDILYSTDDVEAGETYDVEDGDVMLYYYNDSDDDTFYAIEGEVDVTAASDTRFEATFEFGASSDFVNVDFDVTDGVVKVSLEEF